MALQDIEGQDRALEFFRSSVNNNKLAHAYLFLGPEGVGKTHLAKNLAKFLNCESPTKEAHLAKDCCDSCASCRKIEGFNHPDVFWIEPEKSRKTSIDAVRFLQREIALTPYEARFKVFIILEAHCMTEEAANSLLKTLEEPPKYSLIILTTDNLSGLLPTIISRCQIIKFSLINQQRLEEVLNQRYKIKGKKAHFLAAQAEGRIGQALMLQDQDILAKKNRLIDQVCHPHRRDSCVDIFDIKNKRELANQIKYLLNWFRDMLVQKVGSSTASIINSDRIEDVKSQAGLFKLQELEQIIFKVEQAHRLIEQNVNPKIALEVMIQEIQNARGSISKN